MSSTLGAGLFCYPATSTTRSLQKRSARPFATSASIQSRPSRHRASLSSSQRASNFRSATTLSTRSCSQPRSTMRSTSRRPSTRLAGFFARTATCTCGPCLSRTRPDSELTSAQAALSDPRFGERPDDPVGEHLELRAAYADRVEAVEKNASTFESTLVDAYHFRHLDRASLLTALSRANLSLAEERTYSSELGGIHSFLRLAPGARPSPQGRLSSVRIAQREVTERAASVAERAPGVARVLVALTRLALVGSSLAHAAVSTRRRAAAVSRILMLTISSVEHDPRVKKSLGRSPTMATRSTSWRRRAVIAKQNAILRPAFATCSFLACGFGACISSTKRSFGGQDSTAASTTFMRTI